MSYDLVIHDARVDGVRVDIAIAGERIAEIGTGLEGAVLDAGGRLVLPAFVQPHIHLDKVRTGTLVGPNRSGTLAEAISIPIASSARRPSRRSAPARARSSAPP